MPRHINIPIYVVHMGCPNQCVFCDQRLISGESCFREENVRRTIESCLATAKPDAAIEIAFFGGSFTGIDRGQMVRLLSLAQRYVDAGAVSGIRMSTRPDYIDPEILRILSCYRVSMVELGIQSLSDAVLTACRRGHTAADSLCACRLLREAGIPFGTQMMIGLPGATVDDEVQCAQLCCEAGASAYRVYPTLVFRHTELAAMMDRGAYTPPGVHEAAERMACVMEIFEEAGVPCLRAGLCETDQLRSDDALVGGPYHPAIGDLARGEIFFSRMSRLASDAGDLSGKHVVIYTPPHAASLAAGHKRRNICRLREIHGIKSVKIIEKEELMGYNIIMEISESAQRLHGEGERRCD